MEAVLLRPRGPAKWANRRQPWIAAYQLAIVAAACTIFLPNLGRTGLWDMDEALYASVAREMFQRGDWVVPWFNGQLFPEKPPLMFWTMMGGFELFGVNEFGARFFSAVMGVGTALIAFHLGRLLFSARVGFWAGLITCSTIVFTVSARAATVDSALTFVTALAMLLFVLGKKGSPSRAGHFSAQWTVSGQRSEVRGQGSDAAADPHPFILHHSSFIIPIAPCVGPTPRGCTPASAWRCWPRGRWGCCCRLAAMGLYMLVANGWRNLLRSAWQMRPFTALLVIAAVAVPWYVEVGRETNWEWPRRFFVDFNLRPFRQPIQTHGDVGSLHHALAVLVTILYYFYHIPGILFGFFPWAVFLGPALVDTVRAIQRSEVRGQRSEVRGQRSEVRNRIAVSQVSLIWRDGCLLASCWFGVWFVFWSVCKTKLPHYLLPAYPALALLVACWIDRWLEGRTSPAGAADHRTGDGPRPMSAWGRGTPGFRRSWRAWES